MNFALTFIEKSTVVWIHLKTGDLWINIFVWRKLKYWKYYFIHTLWPAPYTSSLIPFSNTKEFHSILINFPLNVKQVKEYTKLGEPHTITIFFNKYVSNNRFSLVDEYFFTK